jgi:hypothetical protein
VLAECRYTRCTDIRVAPTSVLDNRLSKLWFRKLLKSLAWRLIYWAKIQAIEFPYQM